jgi:hypothetical protein
LAELVDMAVPGASQDSVPSQRDGSNSQCALGILVCRLDEQHVAHRWSYGRDMREETLRTVDEWWATTFGIERAELWVTSTVRPHAVLGDYPGWFVVWREKGVHISTPSAVEAREVQSLSAIGLPELADAAFWKAFGLQRGLTLHGPSVHAYLDEDPGAATEVVVISDADLDFLREGVPAEEWGESGWEHEPAHQWGIVEDGRVVAAANLTDWGGTPRDVGVLVSPHARGRGLAEAVGRHAASQAIREHGVARWRAQVTDLASVHASRRLGFEPWATQLALRPSLRP